MAPTHARGMLHFKQPNGRYRPATDDEQLAHLPHEVFALLFLDTRHRLLSYEELFRGTVDGATVYPREVVKRALR